MSMLQKGVALILTHSLTNSGANIGKYCCIYNGGLVKDESHISKPKVRESNKSILYGLMPLTWQYQILEKSRDRRVSLISRSDVVGQRDSKMTPCHTFSLDGQWKRRWLAESLTYKQTGQRGKLKTLGMMKFKKLRLGMHLVMKRYITLR